MATVKKIKQLVVNTPNEVGTLEKVCRAVRETGSSISHACISTLGEEGRFMLNVEDADTVRVALEKLEYEVTESEALDLQLDATVGSLEPIAKMLGDAGVDVEFAYGTTADGQKVNLILSTNDNDRAVALING